MRKIAVLCLVVLMCTQVGCAAQRTAKTWPSFLPPSSALPTIQPESLESTTASADAPQFDPVPLSAGKVTQSDGKVIAIKEGILLSEHDMAGYIADRAKMKRLAKELAAWKELREHEYIQCRKVEQMYQERMTDLENDLNSWWAQNKGTVLLSTGIVGGFAGGMAACAIAKSFD